MSGDGFIYGVTDASSIDNSRLLASGFVPFVCGDMAKRVDPAAVFPGVKSILVVGVPYGAGSFYSNLSSLGAYEDYHKRVKDVLRAKADELARIHGPFKYKILVDGPALCERSLAVRAGLGFFGKNGLVISPEFGSRFNIGIMLTDIPEEELCLEGKVNLNHTANVSYCPEDCDICIRNCPTGALNEGKPLDVNLCISYLTQKEELTKDEEKRLHGQLYGCDICQNVCPKNARIEAEHINPEEILALDEITGKFGHTAMSFKIHLLKRNALIAISKKTLK